MFDPIVQWIQENTTSATVLFSVLWGIICLAFIFTTGIKAMSALNKKNGKEAGIWFLIMGIILIFGVAGIMGIIALLKNFTPSGIDRQGTFAMVDGGVTDYLRTAAVARGLV